MESDLGSPGKTRKLIIWTSWPSDCLASWLAGRRSLVKPMSVLFCEADVSTILRSRCQNECEADVRINVKPMSR